VFDRESCALNHLGREPVRDRFRLDGRVALILSRLCNDDELDHQTNDESQKLKASPGEKKALLPGTNIVTTPTRATTPVPIMEDDVGPAKAFRLP
jgi:hypothetical protein